MKYDRPLLIIGAAKSGTTVLNHIVRACSEAYHTMECLQYSKKSFGRFRQFLNYIIQNDKEKIKKNKIEHRLGLALLKKDRKKIIIKDLSSYIDKIQSPYDLDTFWDIMLENETIYGDKRPHYLLEIDFILEAFPKAKFLVTIRDPRDIWCSQVRNYREKISKNERPHLWMEKSIQSAMYANPHIGQGMNAIERLVTWLNVRKRYNLNYLEVYYRDMCNNPDIILKEIANFTGIDRVNLQNAYDRLFTPTHFGVWKEFFEKENFNPKLFIPDYYYNIMEQFGFRRTK